MIRDARPAGSAPANNAGCVEVFYTYNLFMYTTNIKTQILTWLCNKSDDKWSEAKVMACFQKIQETT